MNTSIIVCLISVIVASVFAAPSEEQAAIAQKLAEIKKTCVASYPVSDEEIVKIRKGEFQNVSEHFECFIKCFMEQDGSLKDNVVDLKKVVGYKLLQDPNAQNAVEYAEECAKIYPTVNNCQEAFAAYKCFHEKF